MKTLLTTAVVALALIAGPAHARDVWTTLADSAPRSVFEDLRDSAPRSADSSKDLVGELQPAFEDLRDNAP